MEQAALGTAVQLAPKAREALVKERGLRRHVGVARTAPEAVEEDGARGFGYDNSVKASLLPSPAPATLGVERVSEAPSFRPATDVGTPLAGDDHFVARNAGGPLP